LILPAIFGGSPHDESPKDAGEVLLSLKATFRCDVNHWGFRFLQQLFRFADSEPQQILVRRGTVDDLKPSEK